MNPKDKIILTQLRQNARMTLTDMSKKTGIPIATIYDRMYQGLDQVIKKHIILLNYDKLGYHIHANIAIKVKKDRKPDFLGSMMKNLNVNSIFRTETVNLI